MAMSLNRQVPDFGKQLVIFDLDAAPKLATDVMDFGEGPFDDTVLGCVGLCVHVEAAQLVDNENIAIFDLRCSIHT
jgi:hypothetical protein